MKTAAKNKKVLFILPVFNEEVIVSKAASDLNNFLSTSTNYNYQILIADNASTDNTASEAIRAKRHSKAKIDYAKIEKKGRGNALREVTLNYKADIYCYLDIDLPIELSDIPKIIDPLIADEASLIICKRTGNRPMDRNLLTKCYQVLTWTLLNFSYQDVQCGIKAFTSEIAEKTLQTCQQNGYFLDTELAARAVKQNQKIKEVKIHWVENRYPQRTSKVKKVSDSLTAFKALLSTASATNPTLRKDFTMSAFLLSLLIVYFAIAKHYILAPGINWQIYTVQALHAGTLNLGIAIIYALIWYFFSKSKNRNLNLLMALSTFFIITVLYLGHYAVFSQDAYWNLFMSKQFWTYHQNPYFVTPNSAVSDPWSTYLYTWRDLPMTHGPLSVYYFTIPTLFSSNMLVSMAILRLISIALFFLCLKVFLAIAKLHNKENLVLITSLILINPIIISTIITDPHNDILLMLLVSLSYLSVLKSKYRAGILLLVLGFFVKYLTILIMPVAIIKLLLDNKLSATKKIIYLFEVFLISASLFYIFYKPFWIGFDGFKGMFYQFNLGSAASSSVFSAILQGLTMLPSIRFKYLGAIVSILAAVYFTLKREYLKAYIYPILIMLLGFATWLMPWYFLWILPLLYIEFSSSAMIVLSTFLIIVSVCFSQFVISSIYLVIYVFYLTFFKSKTLARQMFKYIK